MKFSPKSEEELAQNLLAPGVYPFQVIAASDLISKSGNEMIELKLNVFDENREVRIYDYLLEKMAHKLRHFADVTGLATQYEKGSLEAIDCDGKQGWVKVGQDKGGNGFLPKNTVLDYVAHPKGDNKLSQAGMAKLTGAPAIPPARQGKADKFDDDIPF